MFASFAFVRALTKPVGVLLHRNRAMHIISIVLLFYTHTLGPDPSPRTFPRDTDRPRLVLINVRRRWLLPLSRHRKECKGA